MSERQPPKHAVEVVITLGADSHADALHALNNYVRMAEREYEGKMFRTVSGGYNAGYHVTVEEHPEQTHDQYVADLTAYLEAERAQEPGSPLHPEP